MVMAKLFIMTWRFDESRGYMFPSIQSADVCLMSLDMPLMISGVDFGHHYGKTTVSTVFLINCVSMHALCASLYANVCACLCVHGRAHLHIGVYACVCTDVYLCMC